MTLPIAATLDWLVRPQALPIGTIVSLIDPSVVPLDDQLLFIACVNLTSDTASNVAGVARRRVVVDLRQPPLTTPPKGLRLPGGWQGRVSLVSTSAQDSAAGVGAQTASVNYLDGAGNAHSETFTLTGKTPVLSAGANYNHILNVTTTSTSGAHNLGTLRFSTLSGTLVENVGGVVVNKVKNAPRPVYQLGVVQNSFFSRYPTTAEQTRILRNWLTNALRAAVGPVEPQDPVFT